MKNDILYLKKNQEENTCLDNVTQKIKISRAPLKNTLIPP